MSASRASAQPFWPISSVLIMCTLARQPQPVADCSSGSTALQWRMTELTRRRPVTHSIFSRGKNESHSAVDFSLHTLRDCDWCACHEKDDGMVGA